MKTFALVSLGCPKNRVDSEIMIGLLVKAGWQFVDDLTGAGLIIVNTCSFIDPARVESVDTILDVARLKKSGSLKTLVVAGCLPQRYPGELASSMPEVDLFVGTGEYSNIVKLLDQPPVTSDQPLDLSTKLEARGDRPSPSSYIHTAHTPRFVSTKNYAYIKISEGCFHGCAFCAIPKIRGKYRSRSIADIVSEAKGLTQDGTKELILIGQDTTSYGRDRKDSATLAKLLSKVAKVSHGNWVRFMYSYPTTISRELLEVIHDHSNICRYLDIPLQHVSDRVLRMMNRRETETSIMKMLMMVKEILPDAVLRTSFIVGFPGETKADHEKLLGFVRQGFFQNVGVFEYSDEEGTRAYGLQNKCKDVTKKARAKALMLAQKKVSREHNKAYIGKKLKVLIEGPSRETDLLFEGRHMGQAPDIDGVVYINDGTPKMGEFQTVEIIEAHDYDLIGKII